MRSLRFCLPVLAISALLVAPIVPGAIAASETNKVPAAQTPKAAPADKSAAGRLTPEQADMKIKDLHKRLKIAPQQEAQWKPVADTMRQNAQELEAAIVERERAWKTMGVVDDLKSYEKLSKTHAAGLSKLVDVFEPFYNNLTPEQKKLADAEFQGYRTRAQATN